MKATVAIIAILAVIVAASSFLYLGYFQFNVNGGSSLLSAIFNGKHNPAAGNGNSQNGRTSVSNEAVQIGETATVHATGSNLNLTELFAKTQQSVVQVRSRGNNPFDASLGSGFVYDNNGHVITNYHVISGGGKDLTVTFSDGTVYDAKIIGTDRYADLAVLYVQGVPKDKIVPLPLGNSSDLQVGEQVAAIGNPFGLSGSMTEGIVSGLDRLIPTQTGPDNAGGNNSPSFSIPGVVQTDAAINPGNSGGPLLDVQGEVIGINSVIFSTTGMFAGVGFAIPSNIISKVVPSLIVNGSFAHPWLGISGANMTPEIAKAVGIQQEPRGFLVVNVADGSPADKAGIRGGKNPAVIDGKQILLGGDVILAMDDTSVRKIDDILTYLQKEKQVGDNIDLTVWRDGKTQEIRVTLGARPSLNDSS